MSEDHVRFLPLGRIVFFLLRLPRSARLLDDLIQRDDEFSDSEDEGLGGRRDAKSHKRPRLSGSPKIEKNGLSDGLLGAHRSKSGTPPEAGVNGHAPTTTAAAALAPVDDAIPQEPALTPPTLDQGEDVEMAEAVANDVPVLAADPPQIPMQESGALIPERAADSVADS